MRTLPLDLRCTVVCRTGQGWNGGNLPLPARGHGQIIYPKSRRAPWLMVLAWARIAVPACCMIWNFDMSAASFAKSASRICDLAAEMFSV